MTTTFDTLNVPARFTATVGPEVAEKLLATQQPASKIRTARVEQYAAAMAAGHWAPEVATITFDEGGALFDGASVLRAVISSGAEVILTIETGVPFTTVQYVGLGRGHSLADRIRHDFTDADLVAAVVNLQLAHEAGVDAIVFPRKAYVPTAVEYALAHATELEQATVRANAILHRVTGILPRHLAWVLYRVTAIDAMDASTFFGRLEDGVLLEEGSAVQQLDAYLRRVRRPKDEQRKTVGMLVKAWNQYRTGSTKKLTFRAGGSNPEVIPELV